MGKDGSSISTEGVLLRIRFWPFAICTVSLPAVSLAICFITGFIFRFDDVNETMCEVKNYIPSISAVTGITPQTYVWRIGIALHSAPRFAVGVIHYHYYLQRLSFVKESHRGFFKKLISLNFWLNTIENASLVGVTYISNRDNYPVHEKIFVVFMVTSLAYMLSNTICFKMCRGPTMTADEEKSYFWKKVMFASIMSATAGLIYFFIKHRLFCEPGAFSFFSLCEYVIAYTNMGYHITAYLDFKDKEWLVATPLCHTANGAAVVDNNNSRTTPAPTAATVTASAASLASTSSSPPPLLAAANGTTRRRRQ
ncbi:acyltransferase PGAP2-like [Babylonia areolata]|uniref:acyltransferase PGAP2-like n=1 Tax=Babylonia areolata TaxID=304850 RepID=UPI003FD09C28